MKLREIAEFTGGSIVGSPDIEISGVSGINEAKEGDITFLSDRKKITGISSLKASAVILQEKTRRELKEAILPNMLLVSNPHLAFARTLEIFYRKDYKASGISKKAIIGDNISFGNDVSVYPLAFISSNARIASRVVIHPHVYIGKGVDIGENSVIYPNVTIMEGTKIGRQVTIHPGSVIGADGFGYVPDKGRHYKMPQVGGVLIEDDVEIGANVTIDRATTGTTVIGSGTKIDNSVQVAHNVKIGKNCIIVAQAGISGSVVMGDGVVMGGQVGVVDHMKIGNGAVITAKAGITQDVSDGQIASGYPSIPHRAWLRSQGIFKKLPEYIKRLNELEKKMSDLKG